jgi:hypothetical protein
MNPRPADEVDFARVQGATTSSIVGKYGEEEQRRTRVKDTSMAGRGFIRQALAVVSFSDSVSI